MAQGRRVCAVRGAASRLGALLCSPWLHLRAELPQAPLSGARLRPVMQVPDDGGRTRTLCFLHARLTGAAAAQAGEHPDGLPAEPGRRVRLRAPEPGQRAQGEAPPGRPPPRLAS